MLIDVSEATESDWTLLENLYQLYLYDYTDFMDWDVDLQGRYPHTDLDTLFIDPERHGYLTRVDGGIAGFALVQTYNPPRDRETRVNVNMDEFFVMRKYRQIGVGRHVATRLFDRFAGVWRVSQLPNNRGAIKFWRKVIADYSHGDYRELTADDGDNVLCFTSHKG